MKSIPSQHGIPKRGRLCSKLHVRNLVKWPFCLPKCLPDELSEILTEKMTNLAGKMAARMAAQNREMGAKSAGIPHGSIQNMAKMGAREVRASVFDDLPVHEVCQLSWHPCPDLGQPCWQPFCLPDLLFSLPEFLPAGLAGLLASKMAIQPSSAHGTFRDAAAPYPPGAPPTGNIADSNARLADCSATV